MLWLALALLSIIILELFFYCGQTPALQDQPVQPAAIENRLGSLLLAFAILLSLFRLPFAFFPYFTKLLYVLVLRPHPSIPSSSPYLDAVRTLGDFLNFIFVILLFRQVGFFEAAEVLSLLIVA